MSPLAPPAPPVHPHRPGVAAFDVDGTLVAGDSLRPFLWRLLGPAGVAKALPTAPATLAAYRAAGRDGAKASLLHRLLAGVACEDVEQIGRDLGRELATRVRPEMHDRLRWHRSLGHRVVLVSASLTTYLEPFGAALGVDEVVATALEVGAGGKLTGRLVGANVRGAEKAARLRALLGPDPVELWAYGDSPGDVELLAMADHPTWVGRRTPDGRRALPGGRGLRPGGRASRSAVGTRSR